MGSGREISYDEGQSIHHPSDARAHRKSPTYTIRCMDNSYDVKGRDPFGREMSKLTPALEESTAHSSNMMCWQEADVQCVVGK